MSTPRFTIKTASGRCVTGVVQGAGGPVTRFDVLVAAVRFAYDSHRIGIYEPQPYHARFYPDFGANGNGDPVDVDLREVAFVCRDGAVAA